MTYLNQLHPWCILCLVPDRPQHIVGRFRRRNEADAHLRILRRSAPTLCFTIMFNPAVPPVTLPTGQ